MSLGVGLALALASAFALNWGWVAQHGAASTLPPLRLGAPLRSLRLLFEDRRWLVGFLVGLGGWALYIGALALAPLSLVQAVAAGGIAVLALLVHKGGTRLSQREWIGVAVGTAGLLLLAATLVHGSSSSRLAHVSGTAIWLAGSALAAGVSAFGALGRSGPRDRSRRALRRGRRGDQGSARRWGAGPFVPAVLAAHGLAFVCLQLGFQRGGALTTAGLSTLLTNALPIAAGIALFQEHLPGGAAGGLRVGAFALVVACAALLARPDQPGLEGTMAACSALPSRTSSPS